MKTERKPQVFFVYFGSIVAILKLFYNSIDIKNSYIIRFVLVIVIVIVIYNEYKYTMEFYHTSYVSYVFIAERVMSSTSVYTHMGFPLFQRMITDSMTQ